ncbi:MAG: hypothetical protein AAF533_17575 [Acidobacteriota bacterium]
MMHDPDWERPIERRYRDPLDLTWLTAARRLGLTIVRDPSCFASSDGQGTIRLAPDADLDPDDCLAQMIFHECCHWLTNGPDSVREEDWGFTPGVEGDLREHACLRVQAHLADAHGLRRFLAPTTIYRQYHDRLGADALAPFDDSARETEIVALARAGCERAAAAPFAHVLDEALSTTRRLRDAIEPFLPDDPTGNGDDLAELWGA